ncbi:uncharacterized [Lates japonicus]
MEIFHKGAAVSSAVDGGGDSKAVDEALEVQSEVHEPVRDAAARPDEECDLLPPLLLLLLLLLHHGPLAVTDAPPPPLPRCWLT